MRRSLAMLALCGVLSAHAAPDAPDAPPARQLEVCFNYGCLGTQAVSFAPEQFAALRDDLAKATDAADERARLAGVIARMYRWAGEQSPIAADRAGDYLDAGVYGRMDCIDHARTTTAMIEALQDAGALQRHRVLDIARRTSWLIMQHFSAVIEDVDSGRRYAVDTWFRDHAEPAVVMDMEQWMDGGYPDDWNARR
jgi:hypothetical protein